MARAADYYVDAQAAGGGNGSLASPWNSVAQVNAHGAFAAGDKILFKRGSVFTGGSGLLVNGNGVSGNPIIYGTYSGSGVYPGTGPLPQINDTTGSGVWINGESHIQVQDLSFNRNGELGVRIDQGNFITILRVDVVDNGSNAAINASNCGNVVIDGCTVTMGKNGGIQFKGTATNRNHDGVIQNCVVNGTKNNDGIVLHNGSEGPNGANFILRNNIAHHCQEQGYDITSGTNVLLENNVSYDNQEGAITIGHDASDVTVRYHRSTNEPTAPTARTLGISGPNVTIEYSTFIGSGIQDKLVLGIYPDSNGAQPNDVVLRNNVFIWNLNSGGTMLQVADSGIPLANERLTIKNNIFTSRTGASPTIKFSSANRPLTYATYVIRNNLYDDAPSIVWNNQGAVYATFAAYKAAVDPSNAWNEKSGDPLFIDAAAGDFHLASTSSPAFDAGTSTLFNNEPAMLTLDIDGNATPQGAAREIGFDELSSASAPSAPTNLTATAASSSTIDLSWTDNSSNETGFEVDRALDSGFSSGLVTNAYTTGANPAMPVLADGLSASTTYYFRARATNAIDDSGNSNTATATTQAGGSGSFQMSGNQVVMEAEHASTRTSSTGGTVYSWTDVTESGASGGASDNAVQSLPYLPEVSFTQPGTATCRADYQITVPAGSAASFFVHVRGRGPTGNDNSVNVSIDGNTAEGLYQTITVPASATLGNWTVSGQALAIPSGTHTVTLWMRENGAIIDKIVVKDNNTLPTGTGPAESSQSGGNMAPVAFADSYSVNEDATLNTAAPGVLGNDTDAESNPLTAILVSGPANAASFALNANGSFTYTPAADYSGADSFTYKANDGTADSNPVTVALTVTGVNDQPTLAAIADPAAINEDATAQTVNLTGIGAGGGETQTLTVTATSGNTALIPNPTVTYTSPNATGSLSYTPVANASGTAVVTVTVNDGQAANNTVTQTFTVTVTGVNDQPTLAAIADPAAINEDATAQTVNLTGIGAGGGESQTLTVTATSGNTALIPNPTVTYTSPSATGSLSYTPVANASGTAVVTVTVNDGQAANNTVTQTFTVNVNAVNDAPSFTKGADQSVTAGAGAQTVTGWATALDRGAANESGQALDFIVSNDNNAIFSVQPAVSASGTLTYTPVGSIGATTSATVTVQIHDDGGTASGGVDTSAAQTFAIAVNPAGGGGSAFQMSGNQVVMEAEHAHTRTAGTEPEHNWTDVTESGASGGASNNAVQALPNSGVSVTPNPSAVSCRADYQINVPAGSAANFYIHLRARADTANDNSVYVSIDGSTATTVLLTPPQGATLGNWVVSAGTLAIPAGTHAVTLWMREDGAVVDKIVVKDNNTLPTGTGPAESSQSGGNSVPSITTTTLPGGTQNVAYSQTLAATGGDGALVWSLDSGTLPNGLSLSSVGVISGTPTAAGPFNFTVRVADSDAVTGASDEDTQALSITVGNGAFQMSGNQVVMEAEHATMRTAATPTVYDWIDVTESGASGGASDNAVQSLPNAEAASVNPGTGSCRADYEINVPAGSAANFYFHLRGRGATTGDESVWVSIDGNTATGSYRQINLPVSGSLGNWVVSGQTLAIPSGSHTVTLWMRENGAIVDKIVVKDNNTLPTGTGPAESPH